MKVKVKTNHVDITKALSDYAEKKMQKLERFFDLIQVINVTLDIKSNSNEADRQCVSAIVRTDTAVIVGKQKSADMYASIDLVMDKLEVQLKKHKEKLKKHKGNVSRSIGKNDSTFVSLTDVVHDVPKERYIKKPMDPEDAIIILQEEGLKLLVFRDMNEKISVVFPTDNSEYGLITT